MTGIYRFFFNGPLTLNSYIGKYIIFAPLTNTFRYLEPPSTQLMMLIASSDEVPLSGNLWENIFIGVLILLLLFCSAMMSGSEAAFFSLNPKETQKLKDDDDSSSRRVIKLLSSPNRLLGTILQANNIVNILLVLLSSLLIGRLFDFSGHPVLEFVVSTVIVTFVLVLFGEAMPKIIGTQHPVGFAKFTSLPLSLLKHTTIPIDKVMDKVIEKKKHAKVMSEEEEEDAYEMLSGAVEMTVTEDAGQKKLLKKILTLPKKSVSEIMMPRVEVETISMDMDNDEVIRTANECGYSRLPVYKEDPEDIRGFLYIKDMLPYIMSRSKKFDWRKHIRQAYFVPGSMKINDLLEELRQRKLHLAIVVDEYGGMDGIVTMEDILEEIVGEISDESDAAENK